jgi:hypothetical protein
MAAIFAFAVEKIKGKDQQQDQKIAAMAAPTMAAPT